MPTGNFVGTDQPVPAPPPLPEHSSRWPCAYYAAPLSEVRPILPRWAPFGCGGAAAVLLLILLVAGALLSGERIKGVLDLMVGVTLGEMKPMYAADISTAQKEEFDTEVKRMRENLRTGKISVQKVQPFFQSMQKAVGDDKITAEELQSLTVAARTARELKKP